MCFRHYPVAERQQQAKFCGEIGEWGPEGFGAAWVCVFLAGARQLLLASRRSSRMNPRLHTDFARLTTWTIHVAFVHELTSKSQFTKRAIPFANLRSLQTGPAVATFLVAFRAHRHPKTHSRANSVFMRRSVRKLLRLWIVDIGALEIAPRAPTLLPSATDVSHLESRRVPCPCGSGRKFKVCCGRNL
jgi:hypothetical protein